MNAKVIPPCTVCGDPYRFLDQYGICWDCHNWLSKLRALAKQDLTLIDGLCPRIAAALARWP